MDKQFLPLSGSLYVFVKKNNILQLYEPHDGKQLELFLILEEGAQVEYISGHFETLDLRVTLHERALFTQKFLCKNAEKRNQTFVLAGKQAQVLVRGAYHFTKDSCGFFTVIQLHTAPYTKSLVEIKTVLDGKARFEYHGKIRIEPTACNSNAHQENKNIILSQEAKALSIPSLEALTNDVQCGHGSAISYISEDHLFYLASRGITRSQATEMIIQGFLQS